MSALQLVISNTEIVPDQFRAITRAIFQFPGTIVTGVIAQRQEHGAPITVVITVNWQPSVIQWQLGINIATGLTTSHWGFEYISRVEHGQ